MRSPRRESGKYAQWPLVKGTGRCSSEPERLRFESPGQSESSSAALGANPITTGALKGRDKEDPLSQFLAPVPVRILVIHTEEERWIAREAARIAGLAA